MPKPSRCRRVCSEPAFKTFRPGCDRKADPVTLFVDEYETIRLVDFYKMTHEQSAQQMQISRTTVTEIYEKARFKIADALVNGKPLVIAGGHYRICQSFDEGQCRGNCRRKGCQFEKTAYKGEQIMKIAIPVKHEIIYQHFGMAAAFKIYTVENNQVINTEIVETAGRGHGAMLSVLLENGVNCLICGGIGEGAIQGVSQAGIELVVGISGEADEAVSAYLAGGLESNTQAACSKQHHSHQHQGHCHCGEHDDCGGHCGDHVHNCQCQNK